jgi:putative intracellular protease/amidase
LSFLSDFIAGRTNKLARDFLGAGLVIVVLCFGAVSLLTSTLDTMRSANRQQLPPRIVQNGPLQTIVRSVLDDNVTTASIGGRTIVLDPCTGKEKK